MKFQLLLGLGGFFSELKGRHWWLGMLIWLVLLAPAQGSVILRVAIAKEVKQVKVGASTTAIVKDSRGKTLGELPGMRPFAAQAVAGGVVLDRWQSGLFWIEIGRAHV